MDVFKKIKELEYVSGYTKKERIVQGVKNGIQEDENAYGAFLPSVNELAAELGYARETIVKAYAILKDSGIVESKHGVGYYVSTVDTDQELTVVLVLYAFHAFQEKFYNTFRSRLGENVNLDIFFHHNNPSIYEAIINSINGKYGMYVIAPIHHKVTQKVLTNIPSSRLLLIDRYEDIGSQYSFVSQEFEKSTHEVLNQLNGAFSNFNKKVLYYRDDSDHPEGIKKAFETYCTAQDGPWHIYDQYRSEHLEKGNVYITISDVDLWELLKDCEMRNLDIGKDVGVLSSNDSPVKEIVSGGVTTFFVDFEYLAQRASEYVLNRKQVKEILDVQLIRRKSL